MPPSVRARPAWQLHLAAAPVAVARAGTRVQLAARDAALLAWLAIEGPTPRARVAALLWPDSAPESARNSLRQRLFQLRKQAGSELVSGVTTLALADDVAHDLDEADGVLGEHDAEVGGEFAIWLEQQRARRRDRVRASLQELSEMAERAGDWRDALSHAGELLALQPLSEEAHRRVMRLHYLAGDRAAALLAFDRCERVLKDEVGTKPSSETLALLATIEASARTDGHVPAAVRVPAAVARPPRRIGRDDAWRALCMARDAAATVLLSAEAGMGKSRLLGDLMQLDPGGAVLLASARPGDAAVAYASLARLVRPLLERAGPAGEPRAPLAWVLPELDPAMPMRHESDRLLLAQSLTRLVEHAVERGLRALLLDDLQFADSASVEMIGALLAGGRCGCVLAMRAAELGASARALVDRLTPSSGTISVALQPLNAAEVTELLDSLGIAGVGGHAQAESLHRHTGGNPLYLLETVKAALERGRGALVPAGELPVAADWPHAGTVDRLIQQRLARLSALALQVARCAAIAGQDNSAALVAQVLGVRPLELADAWAELESAQVFRDAGFAHDLIAEATQAGVPHAVAVPLHAEIAAWMEHSHGEPARVAAHWVAARQPLRAVPHLRAGARRARDAWRISEAASMCEQAARILSEAGDRDGAFDAYFDAVDCWSEVATDSRIGGWYDAMRELVSHNAQRAMLALVEVVLLVERGQGDAAFGVIQRALPLAERTAPPDVQAELWWDLAVLHWGRREVADAARAAEQALALLEGLAPGQGRMRSRNTQFKLLHALGTFCSALGRYDRSQHHLMRARDRARESGERDRVFVERSLAGNSLEQGDLAAARRWSRSSSEPAQRLEIHPNDLLLSLGAESVILAAAGELGAALVLNQRVDALCEQHRFLRNRVDHDVQSALLWFALGRRDLAQRRLRALRGGSDIREVQRAQVEATWLWIGEAGDAQSVLELAAASEDFGLRASMLCLAQPGCDAERLLPLLALTQSTAREGGAHGLWLMLQVARVRALRMLGREAAAAQAALLAWQRVEAGVHCRLWLPDVAAPLCAALQKSNPDLAQAIALRALSWMQAAAATLPQPWRSNYLQRAPALQALHALPRLLATPGVDRRDDVGPRLPPAG